MTTLTIELPSELAQRILPLREQLPQILERGLRQSNAINPLHFADLTDVFEFLVSLPSPTEIISLRPSAELQKRISLLLEKNRMQGLSATEEAEWQQIEYLEHLVRMAKAKAYLKLQADS